MKYRETVKADNEGIARISSLVREYLLKHRTEPKEADKMAIAAEEAAGGMAEQAGEDASIEVVIRPFPDHVSVILTSKGREYDPLEGSGMGDLLDDEMDYPMQQAIRGILIKSFADRMKYRHKNGVNRISFVIFRSPRAHLYRTLGAMAAAAIIGLILSRFAPGSFNDALRSYILVPVYTIYLNALKMVVAPVVFLSIVSCIVQFSDLSELGRIGGRTMSVFVFTTLIASLAGIGLFYLFRPGIPLTSGADLQAAKDITSQTMNISLKDMIVGIVPSDFLEPFVSSNMLQLIFLAVFCGVIAGRIGRYSKTVTDIFEAFNELFLRMTTAIIYFMPAAVFCSICSMMLTTGVSVIVSVLGIFATFLLGLLFMIFVYCLILAIYGRVNPFVFIRKYVSTMTQVFSVASSNASIPLNMKACENLGVPKKIYCLTIPLGATLNMDGGCIYMGVFSMALAKSYGVTVPAATIAAMIVTIIVMSMGAPGVAGSGLICLSVLLTQMGVPAEAVALVMGIDALVGMFRCMSNCTGDVMTSIIVAKKEKVLDMEKYR